MTGDLGEAFTATDAILLVGTGEDCFERSDNCGIELSLDSLRKSQPCNTARHRVPIRAIRGHCVVCIGDSNDPRQEWDVIAGETVGVALTIHALMMMAHDRGNDIPLLS